MPFCGQEDPPRNMSTVDDTSNDEDYSSDGEIESPAVEHDEYDELQKRFNGDNVRVRMWRIVLVVLLLLTGIVVTVVTYRFLVSERRHKFDMAFSGTVASAAVEQQVNIREAFVSIAQTVTASAQSSNATWPFYTLPFFESFAENFFVQSRAEIFAVFNAVERHERENWTQYAASMHGSQIKEGHMLAHGNLDKLNDDESNFHVDITKPGPEGFVPDGHRDVYFPTWSWSPPLFSYGLLNWNIQALPDYDNAIRAAITLANETVITRVRPNSVSNGTTMTENEHSGVLKLSETKHPHSFMFHPVHKTIEDPDSKVVAMLGGEVAWGAALIDVLPSNVVGIHAVIRNSCGQSFTYLLEGPDAIFVSDSDLHEDKYDPMSVFVDFALHSHPNFTMTPGHCQFSMSIYPTERFQAHYDTHTPEFFALVLAISFILVAIVFWRFDLSVALRNHRLLVTTARSNAIVSSLFPGKLRDRLINEGNDDSRLARRSSKWRRPAGEAFVGDKGYSTGSKPLADIYLETTVLFADIVGFTAWSSVRKPFQVFMLLETIFAAFDELAQARRVFKVETVGDCFVAVTGLPEARKDHAVAMARFARDILVKMAAVTKELEVALGPETGDLCLRIGMHSGPVTAGVLRGERSRFQLFGDTMNTCARIESTGEGGRIHLSEDTARLLTAAGKDHWLQRREEKVQAKGKGYLTTFWLNPRGDGNDGGSTFGGSESSDDEPIEGQAVVDDRTQRLVDWNAETLLRILKQIVAIRDAKGHLDDAQLRAQRAKSSSTVRKGTTFLDEVQEIIALPEFTKEAACGLTAEEVEISPEVVCQLRDYVSTIAALYRKNAFHNFEHASHVTMSVVKLLSRIIAPVDLELDEDGDEAAARLHDHTYGITSDPLTQFACAFSALIHDVDHTGAPNSQLLKENPRLASYYGNRSIAEQNSLEIAWDLLMDDMYADLLGTIVTNEEDLARFRQLVVNIVMATDIVDKDLKALRNARWDRAFKQEESALDNQDNPRDVVNRKATIVIEHLIQASDVSHTMQHWHIYRKWNERFFMECYDAYQAGRAEKDPAEEWYQGEIGFFDFYIIPLAKKLKDCGVFGKSSDEYLNYAVLNRREWDAKGREIVESMVEKARVKDCAALEA